MNWKLTLEEHEKAKRWAHAVILMDRLYKEQLRDVEFYIRYIYLLHNIILEEDYPEEEAKDLELILKKIFDESLLEFSNNAEYLFFIGRILHIAEWYFGINEGMRPPEETLAVHMQKKAWDLEPDNLLYELCYKFSLNKQLEALRLAKILLYEDQSYINWLNTKGFPGQYISETFPWCIKEYSHLDECKKEL